MATGDPIRPSLGLRSVHLRPLHHSNRADGVNLHGHYTDVISTIHPVLRQKEAVSRGSNFANFERKPNCHGILALSAG
jgi:hypothetical protein